MGTRRRRVRSLRGLVPWVLRQAASLGRWAWRHPRPAVGTGIVIGIGWLLWGYAQRAEAFKITHIAMPAPLSVRVPDTLLGQNLWSVDLQALAHALSRQEPTLKRIRVLRRPPNTIQIEALPRHPIAQVRLGAWHAVDPEGFILPEGSREPNADLVRIVGLSRGRDRLSTGVVNRDDRLELALRVLQALRRWPGLADRRITELNVADLAHLRFTLEDALEIRCGTEGELTAQLRRLDAAFGVIARRNLTVRYIDVRFDEPVLGPAT